eukprot:gene12616-2305_t
MANESVFEYRRTVTSKEAQLAELTRKYLSMGNALLTSDTAHVYAPAPGRASPPHGAAADVLADLDAYVGTVAGTQGAAARSAALDLAELQRLNVELATLPALCTAGCHARAATAGAQSGWP